MSALCDTAAQSADTPLLLCLVASLAAAADTHVTLQWGKTQKSSIS